MKVVKNVNVDLDNGTLLVTSILLTIGDNILRVATILPMNTGNPRWCKPLMMVCRALRGISFTLPFLAKLKLRLINLGKTT